MSFTQENALDPAQRGQSLLKPGMTVGGGGEATDSAKMVSLALDDLPSTISQCCLYHVYTYL